MPSIGDLFERLEKVRTLAAQAAQKSTEFYERDIAHSVTDLGHVVADMLYLLRDHLSCHDCDDEGGGESVGSTET